LIISLQLIRKLLRSTVFSHKVLESRDGFLSLEFSGKGAFNLFETEAGGHRWQGLSGDRIHTSTVTVAVLNPKDSKKYELNFDEIEIQTIRGSGHGGQKVNKTESTVCVTHIPTGIKVRIQTRSQTVSKQMALEELTRRLEAIENEKSCTQYNSNRKGQIGSGMRGDKIRTYREQDDQVTDHITGKTWKLSKWLRGQW
jgi:peptide chain release factor 1